MIVQGFACCHSSESSGLGDDVKNLPIPKELQSFNEPGLKPDLPADGERRRRRQRDSFDPAADTTVQSQAIKTPKKSKFKKKESRKKHSERKQVPQTHVPAAETTASPITTGNAALDVIRQLQQGGVPLQGLVPAGAGTPGMGQQIVIQNLNIYVLPDPKK
jgi:hypothetical protein